MKEWRASLTAVEAASDPVTVQGHLSTRLAKPLVSVISTQTHTLTHRHVSQIYTIPHTLTHRHHTLTHRHTAEKLPQNGELSLGNQLKV